MSVPGIFTKVQEIIRLPASGSFPMSWLFASDSQNIGASASASILPMAIQGDFL